MIDGAEPSHPYDCLDGPEKPLGNKSPERATADYFSFFLLVVRQIVKVKWKA